VNEDASGRHVMILGAAGMVGAKLARSLAERGRLGVAPIATLTLVDVVAPPRPQGSGVGTLEKVAVDLVDPDAVRSLVVRRPDVVFHLAAVVSGEAEADLDKGYAVNLDATRSLLDAIRDEGERGEAGACRPRVVFTSSIAVFGPPFPERIDDDFLAAPATSYGTQKAMAELLLADLSRRGYLDGIALRLPTICIRPGTPNLAASGFFSNILREPLVGQEAVLPVDGPVRHWFASPRAAVGFLEHAATLDTAPLGQRRSLNMPGLSATVEDQIDALRRFAGEDAVALIRREPDPAVEAIVATWPRDFETARARQLGFVAETSIDDIVRVHIEDELGGRLEAWDRSVT
jgi:D-erythronate 2-dehydrogenase